MTRSDYKAIGTCPECKIRPHSGDTVTCATCRENTNARVREHLNAKREDLRARGRCVDCECRTSRYRCVTCGLRLKLGVTMAAT